MPCDYKKYPANWKTEIRPRILKRAKNKCEFCRVENYKNHPVTGSRVILTIAHLDHNTENNTDDNLRALCQRCHNGHDIEFRKQNRIKNRINRLENAGQIRIDLHNETEKG